MQGLHKKLKRSEVTLNEFLGLTIPNQYHK